MLQKQTLDKLASEAVVVKAANITTAGAAAASHGGGTCTRIDEKSRFVLKIRLFLDDVCFFKMFCHKDIFMTKVTIDFIRRNTVMFQITN